MDIKVDVTLNASPDLLAALNNIAASLKPGSNNVPLPTETKTAKTANTAKAEPSKPAGNTGTAAEPELDLVEVRKRAAAYRAAKGDPALAAALSAVGASKLTEMPKEKYAEFVKLLAA